MKRRLFLFLFIAALLLVLGALAAACGDGDDDGDGSDEDAIRNVIQELVATINDRDSEGKVDLVRLAETHTANFATTSSFRDIDDPNFKLENLEILSVTIAGDEATASITVLPGPATVLLQKEDGRWLIDIIR